MKVVGPLGAVAPRATVLDDSTNTAGSVTMTGHALIVGVSTANPAGWTARALPGVLEDLRAYPPFFEKRGFETTTLPDHKATHDAVLNEIKAAARKLRDGDFFAFAFSGHGAEKGGPGGDESQDELLLTYDEEIVDDELGEIWPKFAAGVRIVLLTDSCHSGTAYRDAVKVGETRRSATRANARPVGLGLTSSGTKDAYKINAKLIHLSGCLDDQTSQDTSRGGAFSRALIEAMDEDQPADYTALHRQIKSRLAARGFSQISQMNAIGPGIEQFKTQLPFDLSVTGAWDPDELAAHKKIYEEKQKKYG